MSTYTEKIEEFSSPRVVDFARRFWFIPVLIGIMAGMFWTRAKNWEAFVRDGTVFFSGNDAWWHFRETMWTVNHWPNTIPWDPWTGYPTGISNGQFGTLYDQIVATVAIVIGGGDPTVETVRMTLLFAPPVAAALTAIPVYLVSKQITGQRVWGVLSALVLALYPGFYFSRGLVGAADHNVVEPLFMCLAMASLVWSVHQTQERVPIMGVDTKELVRDLVPGLVSGVAVTLYLMVWPPGLLLVGIFGVFTVIVAVVESIRGNVFEHMMLHSSAVGIGMTVSLLPSISLGSISPTVLGPLHIAFGLLLIVGPPIASAIHRRFGGQASALSVVGGIVLSCVVVAVAFPSVWNTLINNLMRIVGLGTSASTRTIAEAQPMGSRQGLGSAIFSQYGATFVLGVIGVLVSVTAWYRQEEHASLLVGIWWVFLFMAAVTQVRFNYYLTPALAIMVGIAMKDLMQLVDMDSLESAMNSETWQQIGAVIIIGLLLPGLVFPAGVTVASAGDRAGPGASTVWEDSNEWLEQNSPDPDMGDPYESTYEKSYEYPDSSYGVMSWWDYGHWITVQAERVPFANPFQQHATPAAKWLLATNESNAQSVVETTEGSGDNIRYAMVDWQMISPISKFGAPVVFNENVSRSDFLNPVYASQDGRVRYVTTLTKQRYYESMIVRLYHFHGSRAEPQPIVVQTQQRQVETESGLRSISVIQQGQQPVRRFQSMEQARAYVQENGGQIGGVGVIPQEDVPALEHHRLVHVNGRSAARSRYGNYLRSIARLGVPRQALARQPRWVKTFERVPGATITGDGPANATVTATVQMNSSAGPFRYTQQTQTGPDGEWSMTVPYSTTGYAEQEEWTNVSVRATGPYRVISGNSTTTVQVPESAVMSGQEIGHSGSPSISTE
jgi:dolichyl-diphosphooligosaccharide--protein glycosyltransferase